MVELIIEELPSSTICLNMIVRDEAHIIEKTLNNICENIPITYWVICDTGSKDNTKELITQFFHKKDIEGEMHDDEWEDFGHNRTLALAKAFDKTDYLFIFDADDYIHGNFSMPSSLEKDSYFFKFGTSFTYKRPLLINNHKRWKFIGVLHEYISCMDGHVKEEHIEGDYYVESGKTGGRHKDPQRHLKDAQILEDAFHKENKANNIGLARRYAFYCGQSYKDAGLWLKSIEYYKERIKFNGWGEEVFYSYYQTGLCYMVLKDYEKAKQAFLDGYQVYPQRSETLYELCKYYRINSKCELANIYFALGHQIPYSNNSLFCNADIYTYLYDYEFFVFYYYLKNKNMYPADLIHKIFYKLLNSKYHLSNVLSNYKFYIKKLEGIKKPINIECPPNYISSTPSIIKYNDGYLVNVRMTNVVYKNGKYLLQEKNEVTKNKTLIMDENFEIKESYDVDDNEKYTDIDNPNSLFFGTQDIRLHNFKSLLIYTGVTSYTKNNEKTIGVVLGNYDVKNKKTKDKLIVSPNNRKCEKNWVLFHVNTSLYCVYEWNPLTICKFKDDALVTVKQIKMPPLFELVRGSTNGCWVEKDNEIWFVCHMVSHENVRHYTHLIIIIDSRTFEIKRMSYPFKFEKIPIEYCLGLIVDDTNVIFTYSVNDSTSNILCVPKKNLNVFDE